MSLRIRLTLILGATFIAIWSMAAAWLLCDLRHEVQRSLDERLGASARMVASLVQQLPEPLRSGGRSGHLSAEQLGMPGGLACQVISVRGEVVAQSHGAPDTSLGALGAGFHDRDIDGVRWRTFTLKVGSLWVSTGDRIEERQHLNRSLFVAAGVPVVVALIGSLALLWFGVGRGLSPLRTIREALLKRNENALEPLTVESLPSELLPLVESQNHLMHRIAQAIDRERQLTGNAAHELRSPLTAIKTHLQVARMTEGADKEDALANAEEGADRLHRTLEQLLLLSRVEGSLEFDDSTPCSPAEIARQALHDVAGHVQNVRVHIDSSASAWGIKAPAVLAVAALRNLIDNAIRHGGSDSGVELRVTANAGTATFCVIDRGPGVAGDQLANMTRRFWRHGRQGGSGLGLSIVLAIVERCGGRMELKVLAPGLEATLSFPAWQADDAGA